MKFTFTLLGGVCLFAASKMHAQNIILSEDFEGDLSHIIIAIPNGSDQTWIDADFDGIPDASGQNRPPEWFATFGFADVDSSSVVLGSNSWTYELTPVANYLILPPIHLSDANGWLYWKSAPYQTPRYLDGLQVLLSTTGNWDVDFSDTLRLFAEYIDGGPLPGDSGFHNYDFSNGFVFGEDGEYIEYHGDSMRLRGVLRPDSVSLADYAGMDVYIAFCHGTVDDNLMSIDDIVVTGNGFMVSVSDPVVSANSLNVFPNPSSSSLTVEYILEETGRVMLDIHDLNGRIVKTITGGTQIKGSYRFTVDVSDLAVGEYQIVLKTSESIRVAKITKI